MLRAIREDEIVAATAGKNVFRSKVQAFTLGAALAGLAGVFYAHYLSYIAPEMFIPLVSINVWVALIAGGSGNNKGAILGAFVLMGFLEGTRFPERLYPHAERISACCRSGDPRWALPHSAHDLSPGRGFTGGKDRLVTRKGYIGNTIF